MYFSLIPASRHVKIKKQLEDWFYDGKGAVRDEGSA